MNQPVVKYYHQLSKNPTFISCIEKAFELYEKGNVVLPVEEQIARELLSSEFVSDGSELTPFIVHNNGFYFQKNHIKEQEITSWISTRAKEVDQEMLEHIKDSSFNERINEVFKSTETVDWQKIGCVNALLRTFSILSGGPGTGKTTTVAKFMALLLEKQPKLNIALVAPTGKAAMRMKTSLNKEIDKSLKHSFDETITNHLKEVQPSTIHRLLKKKPGTLGNQFRYNKENLLPYDVILVDEASMIDLDQMYKLMIAIPSKTKTIFLGDHHQLSPVGAGSVFADISAAMNKNIFETDFEVLTNYGLPQEYIQKSTFNVMVHLKKTYRFDEDSTIHKVSSAILKDSFTTELLIPHNEQTKEIKGGVFHISPRSEQEKLLKAQMKHFRHYIEEQDIKEALNHINDIVFLCATKGGSLGVHEVNKRIESYLHEKGWIKKDKSFYNNQLVMITKNNYQLNLFNGDTGIVRENDAGELYFHLLDDSEKSGFKSIPVQLLKEWETAYAITIHKSQGSEFKQVVIALPENTDNEILSKELLYTAITRSSYQAFLWATTEVLNAAVNKSTLRVSGIQNRLQK